MRHKIDRDFALATDNLRAIVVAMKRSSGMIIVRNSAAPKLNIGVVGLGRMGQRHALNVLHRISKACLYSVCSPTPHELEWARNKLEPEGVNIFSDFYEMIDAPGLAAVIVASSTELHIEHTLAAVKRGICVLCEKPLTKDLAEVSTPPILKR